MKHTFFSILIAVLPTMGSFYLNITPASAQLRSEAAFWYKTSDVVYHEDTPDYCESVLLGDHAECSNTIKFRWNLQGGYDYCDGQSPGILEVAPDCNTVTHPLVEVFYPGTYLQALSLLGNEAFTQEIIESVYPTSKTIIQVLTKEACSPIFIDAVTHEVSVPKQINCQTIRSSQLRTFTLLDGNIGRDSTAGRIKKLLGELPIVKENKLAITILNKDHYYYALSNQTPEINIILDKNYHEIVSILLLIDALNGNVTASVDAYYAPGLFPPPFPAGFYNTSPEFYREVNNFIEELQRQLNEPRSLNSQISQYYLD